MSMRQLDRLKVIEADLKRRLQRFEDILLRQPLHFGPDTFAA